MARHGPGECSRAAQPALVPLQIIAKIAADARAVMFDPALAPRLEEVGLEPVVPDPAGFGALLGARAAIATREFAAAETLQIQLQSAQLVPAQFVEMIPYLLTMIALAGVVARAVPPAALGKVYE